MIHASISVSSVRCSRKPPSWKLEYASSGAEALEKIKTHPPDLVITDLLMPGMDGLELLAELGRTEPYVPVVLITGNGSDEIASRSGQ
jgi:CheY-like chemotaxis protein